MPKKILLIEADEAFAGLLTSALEDRGASIEVTSDGKAAPGIAADGGFDAIVLCVELPKMSGYAVCNKLKKNAALKTIPLIITSSEATPKTFEQHKKLKTRADDYVIKPCEPEEVVEKVHALIGLEGDGASLDEEIDLLDEALEGLEIDDDTPSDEEGTQVISTADLEGDDLEEIALDALEVSEEVEEVDSADLAIDALGEDGSLDLLDEPMDNDDGLQTLDDDLDSDGLEALDALEALDEGSDDDGDDDQLLDVLDPVDDLQIDASEESDDFPDLEMEPAASPVSEQARGAGASARLSKLEDELAKVRKERDAAREKLSSVQDDLRGKTNELAAFRSGGGGSSNKDVIRLKGELTSRDKEILSLKQTLNEKEKEALDWQEKENELEMKAVDLEERAMTSEAAAKTLEEKVAEQAERFEEIQSELTQARDEVRRISELEASLDEARAARESMEGQVAEVGQRLAEAASEATEARSRVSELEGELEEVRAAAEKNAELEEKVQTLESENKKHENRLLKAYQNLKGEEQLRERIRKALEVGLSLLDEAPASVIDTDEGLEVSDEDDEAKNLDLDEAEELALESLEF